MTSVMWSLRQLTHPAIHSEDSQFLLKDLLKRI
jgi:hypothetical protein